MQLEPLSYSEDQYSSDFFSLSLLVRQQRAIITQPKTKNVIEIKKKKMLLKVFLMAY